MAEEDKTAAPAPASAVETSAPAPAAEPAPVAEAAPAEPAPVATETAAPEPAAAEPAAAASADASKPKSKSAPPSRKNGAKPRESIGSKKAAAPAEPASFNPGDIVLGRLKGYPPWPARIIAHDNIPQNVLSQRPGKGGSSYCTQFFPAGDFSWLNARDITPLSPKDIQSFLAEPHRKASGGLRIAYQTAADPTEWDDAQARYREEQEAADQNVDELEEEDEDTPSGSKRKRAAPAETKASAGKKKSKTEGAASAKGAKKGAAEEKSKSTVKAAPKPDESKDAKVDENDPLAGNPEASKVKDWRHKLQRAFLGKSIPEAGEMDQWDELFTTIEAYKDMTIEYLQHSKIGKVMKRIATLDGIPRDDEFKITERASKLMNEWQDFISKHGGEGDKENGHDAKDEAPISAAAE